jgi:hypothetical protein
VIVGITQVRNEADVIESVLRHTLAEGIDKIWVADHLSTDGTWDILQGLVLEGLPLVLSQDDNPTWYQAERMNYLSDLAYELGADWTLPFDGDEFFYAPSGRTIAEELATVPPGVRKLYCRCWRHTDRLHRVIEPQREKVAYRSLRDAGLVWGQHDVNLPGGTWGVLALRHWQYRSWEQFYAKVRSLANLPAALIAAQGPSPLYLLDDAELHEEWLRLCAAPAVFDPIPDRSARVTA